MKHLSTILCWFTALCAGVAVMLAQKTGQPYLWAFAGMSLMCSLHYLGELLD